MSGHTKGPYEVHVGLDYITVMRGDETTDQGIRFDNLADAQLFAAAPELLVACSNWIDWLASDGWREDDVERNRANDCLRLAAIQYRHAADLLEQAAGLRKTEGVGK
jgi:hypothetical protein